MGIRYVVRDKATKGCDFLMWGDDDADAAQVTLAQCHADGIGDQVELVTMPSDQMDEHTKRLIDGEPDAAFDRLEHAILEQAPKVVSLASVFTVGVWLETFAAAVSA